MADSQELIQASFLDKLSRLQVGELLPVPIADEDIGGELLNILSKGLYTNPLDAIREYVQNSIDAEAKEVEIQVTGNSVYVLDRGNGMTRDELLKARDFGVSNKSIEENVGFRGIGIYSGFDLCERLVIRTKTKDDPNEHILEFEFQSMRNVLDVARKSVQRPSIPLAKLLSENTYYRFEPSNDEGSSFTLVQLEELSDNHIHRLSNVRVMESYILRNLPIRFSEEFRYGQEIEENLSKFVRGYKSARVILRIEGASPVTVEKPNIPNLEPPIKGEIFTRQNKSVGYFWACLTSTSAAITSKDFAGGKFAEFAGITYKVKGFTIGGREVARRHMSRIPDWWTGEIYVTDPNVLPTSARDDFEAGPAKDALETAVSELLNGQNNPRSLQKIAVDSQMRRRADAEINKVSTQVDDVQKKVDSGDFDPFDIFSPLDQYLGIVKKHKGKSSDRAQATQLEKRITKLQNYIRKEINDPTPIAERKREAGMTAIKSAEDNQTEEANTEPVVQDALSQAQLDIDTKTSTVTDSEPSQQSWNENLIELIERTGWTIEEQDIELIQVIGEAIADTLGFDSEVYLRLMRQIEERLTDLIEEG